MIHLIRKEILFYWMYFRWQFTNKNWFETLTRKREERKEGRRAAEMEKEGNCWSDFFAVFKVGTLVLIEEKERLYSTGLRKNKSQTEFLD